MVRNAQIHKEFTTESIEKKQEKIRQDLQDKERLKISYVGNRPAYSYIISSTTVIYWK